MTLFQACSLASDSERSEKMNEAQRKRELEKRMRQRDLERRRRQQERRKEDAERKRQRAQKMREYKEEGRGPLVSKEQKRKAEAERERNFFYEKLALGASEEQWELIKAKLEKVRHLRRQADSTTGAKVAGGPSDNGKKPTPLHLEWDIPWKNMPDDDITEAQRIVEQIIRLLARNSTRPEAFRIKMAALRVARKQEPEIEKRLTKAREELRELLTTRQEATLVLMRWL